MSRNRIVLLLYVLTFLLSVYLKFVNPHRLDRQPSEFFRENSELDIGGVVSDSLNYYWTNFQPKIDLEYHIARQIDSLLYLNSDYFTNGPGTYNINYSDVNNRWEIEFQSNSTVTAEDLVFLQSNNQVYYFIVTNSNEGNKASVIQKDDVADGYLLDKGVRLTVYREIPLNNNTAGVSLGYVYKARSSSSSASLAEVKSVLINLQDSTATPFTFDQTINLNSSTINRFSIPVKYRIPSTLHAARGRYLDIVYDNMQNRYNFNTPGQEPKPFQVKEEIESEFKILHPPGGGHVDTLNTPVGIPFRQVISANFPIESITLIVDGERIWDNMSLAGLALGRQSDLANVKITPTNDFKVLDLKIPIKATQNLNDYEGQEVSLSIEAKSGLSSDSRQWKVKVKPFRFQVWPPVRPVFLSESDEPGVLDEKGLFERFIRQYPTEEDYLLALRRGQNTLPIVYESRRINFFYSLQNVDGDQIKQTGINNTTIQPYSPGTIQYTVGADVNRLNLNVLTASGQYKRIPFNIAQVPSNYTPTIGESNYLAGPRSVSFFLKDFFGDPVTDINQGFRVGRYQGYYFDQQTSRTQFYIAVPDPGLPGNSIQTVSGLQVKLPYNSNYTRMKDFTISIRQVGR